MILAYERRRYPQARRVRHPTNRDLKCFAAMPANRRRLQFRVKHGIRNDRYFEHSVALTCASDSQSETVLIGLLRTSFV